MLHTVNKSPFQNESLESCVRMASEGDCILLLEDGVFGAATGTSKTALVEAAMKTVKIYALSADVKARGIKSLIDGIEVTDYAGFVDLVDQNKTHSWL
uniref:Intracellular sulfur oxidation protein DsrH/TusB n=1 Tax=Magnetococcus massalia (strain MO-1) TaxID=451514 RepID=A0A1S7LF33_MAGMO|nr:Intracellular sulfur oxidation protein DsrH/TusB [Candidatus Magnetococcus massalia]